MTEHENETPDPGGDHEGNTGAESRGEWVYRRQGLISRAGGRVIQFRDEWVETSTPTDESIEANFVDKPTGGLGGWQRRRFWPWAKTPVGRTILAVVAVVAVILWMVLLVAVIG